MSYYIVDIESDHQIPGEYGGSMVCFGAVKVMPSLDITFYGQTKPIVDSFNPEALAISGFSRETHETFDDPLIVMENFSEWIKSTTVGRPVFLSDNLAFDWQWINYYFHRYLGNNPFGWSGRRIGDIYCGLVKDFYGSWKKTYRITPHDHNPVNDAKGNAEALMAFKEKLGLKISFK